MRTDQLLAAQIDALRQLADASTSAAAEAFATMVGTDVVVTIPRVHVCGVSSAAEQLATPMRASVVHVALTGEIAGHALVLVPHAAAELLLRTWAMDAHGPELRQSALLELGNVLAASYLNNLVQQTGLAGDMSVPSIGSDDVAALLQMPLAAAASDSDVVVALDATLDIPDSVSGGSLRTGCQLRMLFVPAPGTLGRILGTLEPECGTLRQIPVPMGELVVTRRPGDVLIARGLGSCVCVALIDDRVGVAAMAHVMLPAAPSQARPGTRTTYRARYADTAVPALVDALERAGGSRRRAQAYAAGGAQMFEGIVTAPELRVCERNVVALEHALARARVELSASDLGGTHGRVMEVHVHPLKITSQMPARGTTITLREPRRRAA